MPIAVKRPHIFPLEPFSKSDWFASSVLVFGQACRDELGLRFRFQLRGALDQLLLPAPGPAPVRRDQLWEHTCFEAFLGPPGAASYWEVNLSPSGAWNLYAFDSYRAGMRPESLVSDPVITASRQGREYVLDAVVPWPPASSELELGIACVIERLDGTKSYWALRHPAERPDFHRRDAFLVRL